jgi:hypothetical protein
MTGWEIIKLIKEHETPAVRRAGDHKVAFFAAQNSSLIKWYPVDVSRCYGDYLTKFFEEPTRWTCQYTVEYFIRELLSNDDWEILKDCDCEHCEDFIHQLTYAPEEE